METTNTKKRKTLTGTVVAHGKDKTAAVLVQRFVKHPKYGKYMKKSKKYQVHDEENISSVGDAVQIEKCRPISKRKHFRILSKKEQS